MNQIARSYSFLQHLVSSCKGFKESVESSDTEPYQPSDEDFNVKPEGEDVAEEPTIRSRSGRVIKRKIKVFVSIRKRCLFIMLERNMRQKACNVTQCPVVSEKGKGFEEFWSN